MNCACTKNSSPNPAARSPSSSATGRFGRRPHARESVKSEKKRKSAERPTNGASARKPKHAHGQKKSVGSKLSERVGRRQRRRRKQRRRRQANVAARRWGSPWPPESGRPNAALQVTAVSVLTLDRPPST